MRKEITRYEIIEQLGSLRLKFEFFRQDYFVFSGIDCFKNHVAMFVRRDVIYSANHDSYLYVNDFSSLSKKQVKFFIISPELEIVYQD